MLKFNASEFYRVSSALRAAEALVEHIGKSDVNFETAIMAEENKKTIRAHMKPLREALTVLGARVTLIAAEELVQSLRGKAKYKDLVENLQHLRLTLRRELSRLSRRGCRPRSCRPSAARAPCRRQPRCARARSRRARPIIAPQDNPATTHRIEADSLGLLETKCHMAASGALVARGGHAHARAELRGHPQVICARHRARRT